MFQRKKIWMTAAGLLALPLVALSGCGGGNSGPSVSPTATVAPTSTSLPLTPTPTPILDDTFALSATFSSIKDAQVPTTFQAAGGQGAIFNTTDVEGLSSLDVSFYDAGGYNNRRIELNFTKHGLIKNGDILQLSSTSTADTGPDTLYYDDFPKGQVFMVKSGTLTINSVTEVVSGQYAPVTIVKFTISNAVMVPSLGGDGTTDKATGTFTLNGTAQVALHHS